MDEYGTARRSAVVRGFIDALTRGGLYYSDVFLYGFSISHIYV